MLFRSSRQKPRFLPAAKHPGSAATFCGQSITRTSDPYWQGIDPAHLFILEPGGIPQIVDDHIEGVVTPEQFAPHYERRDAEHPSLDSPLCISAQRLFDGRIVQRRIQVWKPKRAGKLC